MTLLEVVVVAALVATMSGLALAGVSEAILQARYRADRARFYLLVREARDRSASSHRSVMVTANPIINTLSVRQFSAPCPLVGPPPGLPETQATHTFSVLTFPDISEICIEAGSVKVPMPLNAQGPDGFDNISQRTDGRLDDSWGEFPTEGALDTGACDTDTDPDCGA
jgi:type II secretory pathway pseudopilin PulG